ncbi:uncharacterized protein LOC144082365 isoform X2 [Stigmatopora argus]
MGTAALSSSLVDIYSSWLKKSKNKHPTSNGRVSTPIQAVSKKEKRTAKKAHKTKSPKINKKDAKWSESVKKEKQQNVAPAAAAAAAESDSDSSLDVEKWQKLLFQMTDVNVMKMDTINALEFSSSSAKCVKKSVRKPQAKPKASTPLKQSAKKRGTSGKETKSSSSKKKTLEKAKPETPSATLNGTPPPAQGLSSFLDQQTMKRDNRRKKRESSQGEKQENGIETGSWENKVLGQPVQDATNGAKLNSEPQEEPPMEEVKRKKKGKKTEKKVTKSLIKDQKGEKKGKRGSHHLNISDNAVKPPKKKKKSDVNEKIFERLAEEVQKIQMSLDPVEDDQQPSTRRNPDSIDDDGHQMSTADVSEKKAKKKMRKSLPGVEAPPQVVERVKKRKAHPEEVKKKKRKGDSAVKDENTNIYIDDKANPNTDKKKKKKLGSTNALPLFSLETPSPSPQKRKSK